MVRNTSIPVETVIKLLATGYSKEQLLEEFPQLEYDDIQACLQHVLIKSFHSRV